MAKKANRILPSILTGHSKDPLPKAQETTLHIDITGWLIMEIRLIIFPVAKDGKALCRQQKQDWELTVGQIMNS